MKNILLLIALVLFSVSCEKNEIFVPENEIPTWLKNKINGYEIERDQNPTQFERLTSFIAWKRYKWNNEYYFEYSDMFSSTFAYPISFDQDTLKVCPNCTGIDYAENKCCVQYVWKGDNYID